MRMPHQAYLLRGQILAVLLIVAAACSAASGAEDSAATPVADSPGQREENPATNTDGADLNKLLDMADRDIGALKSVRVSAAALQAEVSTVSRQASTIGKTPAAVYVITNEMIRRSGATCIPEALRMAPGVQVARIDANKWAVSIRGFNGRFANKLLVQIDGRTVYNPLDAGVYWEVQDILMEDIERIEVIRGPGASVWGANAVNGVINVITKSTRDTQGVFAQAGGGTAVREFASARYGGQSGDLSYRLYGKWLDHAPGYDAEREPSDQSRNSRGGFRADWGSKESNLVTFQGDCYDNYDGRTDFHPQTPAPYSQTSSGISRNTGGNGLLRWTHFLDEDSDWSVQTYYDHAGRKVSNINYQESTDVFDVDFQHRFPIGERQQFIWGCGYRNTKIDTEGGDNLVDYTPAKRADDLFSYFAQDDITLSEDLWVLTVGSKFEHNDYTNFEYQPTVRLLWTPSQRHSIWSAISRAVRTPSASEVGIYKRLSPLDDMDAGPGPHPQPRYPVLFGNPNLESEKLIAYEIGFREQTTEDFSWDLALFFQDYQQLIGMAPGTVIHDGPHEIQVFTYRNLGAGQSYGAELATDYKVRTNWHLRSSYTLLNMYLTSPAGRDAEIAEGSNPNNQFSLTSSWDLGKNWELDLSGRYVDTLAALNVPSYIVGDVRVAWHPRKHLEFSVLGRELFNTPHAEFGNDPYWGIVTTKVLAEVYGMVTVRR
jgi:iron complex outermembrane receptor protein